MKNCGFLWISVVGAIAVVILFAACDSSGGDGNGSSLPDQVLDSAEGVFDFVGEFLMVEDPSTETFPDGVTVVDNPDETRTLTFTNFEPEDGVTVNGTMNLEQLSENPLKVSLSATLSGTGEGENITITLSGTATWAMGETMEEDDPSSITGTFTYNGTSYNLSTIMEELAQRDDDDGDGDGDGDGDENKYSPLPIDQFPPGNPSSTLCFYLIATRETFSSPWEAPTEGLTQLDFTHDRDSYEMYVAGTRENEGALNWHEPDMTKLDLYDADDTLVYSFSVGAFESNFFYLFATRINGEVIDPEIECYFSTDPVFDIEDIQF
ncbi:MAG TPA: hypothetical protein GXZ47_04250 [Treponema sp.]|nr:hypothetical protein [Treponema sp.]